MTKSRYESAVLPQEKASLQKRGKETCRSERGEMRMNFVYKVVGEDIQEMLPKLAYLFAHHFRLSLQKEHNLSHVTFFNCFAGCYDISYAQFKSPHSSSLLHPLAL